MARDRDLIQIVDAAMADAVRRSGPWIACKPGCMQCCLGPFPITMLDAVRLRSGLAGLERADPVRAAAVRRRAEEYAARLPNLPEDAADEEPCPALDPGSGTCDLYESRPVTCRMFGPAVRSGGDAVGLCELCYEGASDEQIAACVVDLDIGEIEAELLGGDTQQTSVAQALAG